MKKTLLEKSIVFILFVLVLIVFSFAQRDTTKMFRQYKMQNMAHAKKASDYTASAAVPSSPLAGN